MGMYSFSIFLYVIKFHLFCKPVFTVFWWCFGVCFFFIILFFFFISTVTLLVINFGPCCAKQAIQQPTIRLALKIKHY